jgi:hypothetical protein
MQTISAGWRLTTGEQGREANIGMKIRRSFLAGVLTLLLLSALTARAEDFWIKKDWKQWSKDECAKILQDSPWTKKWSKGNVNLTASLPGNSGASSEGAGGENSPEIHYVVQFRSSLPIREATVRLQQIQLKYDQMADAQKKEFDARAEALLGKTYDDVILVHVDYGSNVQTFERQMATYWKSIPPESIPIDLYLINERGDRVAPTRFVSPQNANYSFDLYFPRMKSNEPFIRDSDKALSVQFTHPPVGTQSTAGGDPLTNLSPTLTAFGEERVLVQYKVDKMMIKGKLSY